MARTGDVLALAVADGAALAATVLATIAALPQLRRVAAGDGRGVSLTGAVLGVVNEVVWVAYAVHQGLWSAVPEAVLMTASNGVLVVCLRRTRAGGWRRAARAGGGWAVALAAVAVLGGPAGVGVVLGAAYGVQVVPAVWTAWRTDAPTGVAAATWAFVVVESLLWGAYGVHHADPATSVLAVVGVLAGGAMLLRKLVTRHRPVVLMAR